MIATADVSDERMGEVVSLALQLRDVGGHSAFDGCVRTIRCHRDNGLVKRVLSTEGRGAVLVIDGGGSLDSALVGDLIAAAAVSNGWAGIIVNGAVRDRHAIGGLPIGMKALGFNPQRSTKTSTGELDVPVTVGGVVFEVGKHVWADSDGVVVELSTGA